MFGGAHLLSAAQAQLELQDAALHAHKVLTGEGAGARTHQGVRFPRGIHCENTQ